MVDAGSKNSGSFIFLSVEGYKRVIFGCGVVRPLMVVLLGVGERACIRWDGGGSSGGWCEERGGRLCFRLGIGCGY